MENASLLANTINQVVGYHLTEDNMEPTMYGLKAHVGNSLVSLIFLPGQPATGLIFKTIHKERPATITKEHETQLEALLLPGGTA